MSVHAAGYLIPQHARLSELTCLGTPARMRMLPQHGAVRIWFPNFQNGSFKPATGQGSIIASPNSWTSGSSHSLQGVRP